MSVKIIDVNANSVEEAFEQSGINWIAEQSEMLNVATGKIIKNMKTIYRNDTKEELGVVGKKYGVIQNSDCFSFFNIICQNHNANICKVIEYDNGSIINLTAEVKDKKFDAKVGDEVGFRFNLQNSFDGKHKASVTFGALRLVCTNGLVAFGKNAQAIEIRHTLNAVSKMDQAIKVWAIGENWYNDFIANVKILNQKMIDKKMVDSFLIDLFGESDKGVILRKKEKVTELFESGKGNKGETAWDLLNGVTEYIDHFSKTNPDDILEYSTIGAGYGIKSKAFELAMKL